MSTRMSTSTASALESKPLNVVHAEPQELAKSEHDADGLLLHLIRTISLYLFVFLSQSALKVTDKELAVFVSDADVLDQQMAELQRRLHATLFTWVQSEVTSNQFDGLLQEQGAFVVIKRLFRQQRTKAAAQYQVLAALLTSYLTQLKTPLVYCDPRGTLSSTLEYLVAKEKTGKEENVPLPMLYPLVNAVDLASIEQRECLDALSNLLKWLTVHDESQTLFTKFARQHHVKFIQIDSSNTETSKSDMGVCFVHLMLRYSDHIFRRDHQFVELASTLVFSDTEDDDVLSEDGNARPSRDLKAVDLCPDTTNSAEIRAVSKVQLVLEATETKSSVVATQDDADPKAKAAPLLRKSSSRTPRKRKKREDKTTTAAPKAPRRANKKQPIREVELPNMEMATATQKPLATTVRVGIAAAAAAFVVVLCIALS